MGTVPVGQILTNLANEAPAAPAITCGERTVTREQLESRANRLARAYQAHGVGQGDVVAVGLPNGIEFYEACFAIWKLGATPLPLSWRLPEAERAAILKLASPALVVGIDSAPGCPALPAGFEPGPGVSDDPPPVRVSPIWKISTSGGSTGRPKLVVSGSTGDVDVAAGAAFIRAHPGQVQLVAGPLYHGSPFTYSMVGAYLGHHLIVLPRFDPAEALRAITRHRVEFAVLVPTMMLRMLRALETDGGDVDLGSLQTVWHLAAPCPPWLKEAWLDLVGPDTLFELYGGTELQAVAVISGREWLDHRGSVGRPIVGEMKVFDGDGREAPPHTVGEIYLRRPAGTPETYRYIGSEARELGDGWESLGDMGYTDADGYLYLTDRRTDMILVGGANIYPAEVEAALLHHPAVASSAVVGIPDEDLGQRLHAVVETTGPVEPADLRGFLFDRLEPHKIPRTFRFVSEPLRDDAGKVRRSAVREREIELLGQAAAAPSHH